MPSSITDNALGDALDRLATQCAALALPDPLLVGIEAGGVWLARWLHARLGVMAPLATLDAGFYRDDVRQEGLKGQLRPSRLPPGIDDRHVLLVDDVLHTGRTVQAALRELFDFGRPASVRLAVLIDRGGRELPVCADAVGLRFDVPAGQRLRVTGPDPLRVDLEAA